jgi:hypothetical protein
VLTFSFTAFPSVLVKSQNKGSFGFSDEFADCETIGKSIKKLGFRFSGSRLRRRDAKSAVCADSFEGLDCHRKTIIAFEFKLG